MGASTGFGSGLAVAALKHCTGRSSGVRVLDESQQESFIRQTTMEAARSSTQRNLYIKKQHGHNIRSRFFGSTSLPLSL